MNESHRPSTHAWREERINSRLIFFSETDPAHSIDIISLFLIFIIQQTYSFFIIIFNLEIIENILTKAISLLPLNDNDLIIFNVFTLHPLRHQFFILDDAVVVQLFSCLVLSINSAIMMTV